MNSNNNFEPRSLNGSEYVLRLFEPTDRTAIIVRNGSTGQTVQRIATAQTIAESNFQTLRHANKSVTDVYGKLKDDVAFRKQVAEQVGIGFELPAEKPEVAPYCTHTGALSHVA